MPEKRHKITHLMLERLINIHKEIRDGNYPNTTELAKKFNAGKGFLQSVVTSNFCVIGFTLQSNTITPEKVTITPSNTKCLLTIFLPKKPKRSIEM